jgi:DNA/RNA-binding protein KIN17
MMRLVLDNPNKIIGEYSKEFEKGYVDILARKYRNKIVDSNKVYGQYISDKSHTHMNATKWTTLTGFIHVRLLFQNSSLLST